MEKEKNIKQNSVKSNFLKGAVILGVASLIIKVLGGIFKIPLGNILGGQGMGYFQGAYAYYNQLLAISTAGIPTAIAKIISERLAVGNDKSANKVLKIATYMMVTAGIVGSLGMLIFAPMIARNTQNMGSLLSMFALVPAIFFVSLLAIYRGYFQGREHMQPYAISQVVEQFSRVVIGLSLAFVLMNASTEYAAAGATLGASLGAFIGFIMIYTMYKRYVSVNNLNMDSRSGEKGIDILKEICIIAVPISIGASVLPIMGIIDAVMVINRLTHINIPLDTAQAMYGSLSGFAQSIINIPQIVTSSVQITIVPSIAKFKVLKDEISLSKNVEIGLRLAMIIGLPCAVGVGLMSNDIIKLLYPLQPDVWAVSGGVLSILGWSIIFLSVYQISTGIIQGMGNTYIPAVTLLLGAVIKMILTYILVAVPQINIYGAAIGTAVAFIFASVLNLAYIIVVKKIKLSYDLVFIKPVIDVVGMAVAVILSRLAFGMFLPSSLTTVLTIAVAGVVYLVLLLLTNTITKEELGSVPGGDKILRVMKR